MIKKHAYLIMAHNNWGCLKSLIKLLDNEANDLYIHIDKKAKDFPYNDFFDICKKSKLFFIKRTDVKWGTDSQVKAEMMIFEEAYKNRPYWYYHLISGSDLILRPVKDICSFFENRQENFIQCSDATSFEWRLRRYYNPFDNAPLPQFLRTRLNILSEIIQYKFSVNRLISLKKRYPKLGKGHNWCDLNEKAVELLLNSKRKVLKFTKFTLCSDEMYKQIILMNADPKKIGGISKKDIRYILWCPGESHPKDLTINDVKTIFSKDQHDYLFARKFNSGLHMDAINLVCTLIEKHE